MCETTKPGFHYRFLIAICVAALSLTIPSKSVSAQDRWDRTATSGRVFLGQPTTVTWGFVEDGTPISPSIANETDDPSSIISLLDSSIGAGPGGADLSQRPWFDSFESVTQRWETISGLEFVYEPNNNTVDVGFFTRGSLNFVPDIRIGGHSLNGGSTLAYNFFPDHGNMVVNTDQVNFLANGGGNFLRLRNTMAHEIGHGLGLPHVGNNNQLMRPSISLAFDGPQIDDIYQIQRRYGDSFEKSGGNDSFNVATPLFVEDGSDFSFEIGSDANHGANLQEVDPDETNFYSIDDNGDVDVYQFTIDATTGINISLEMVGPTYNIDSSPFNMSQQSDLDLQLFGNSGQNLIGTSSSTGLGVTENIAETLDAGTYFIEITGRNNAAQFYQLSLTGTTVVLLGDVNRDGVVNFLDLSPFITLLSTGTFQAEADMNEDGVVNFFDIAFFITKLS